MARPKFTRENAQARLDANEYLYPLEVALLTGGRVTRWRVIYHARRLGIEARRTVGNQRAYDPVDVARLLYALRNE